MKSKDSNLSRILFWSIVVLTFFACSKEDTWGDGYVYDGEKVTDIDGNIYNTVEIGSQLWMAENLKTTTYKDGAPIPNITDGVKWLSDTLGAYCNYDNDADNAKNYGRLYNWYAVNTHNLCPEGWHVPSRSEWIELVDYMLNDSIYTFYNVGLAIKSTFGWNDGGNGDDYYRFRAVPAGNRSYSKGTFKDMGNYAYWWDSNVYILNDTTFLAGFMLVSNTRKDIIDLMDYPNDGYDNLENFYERSLGLSVRCLKDSD